MGQRVWVSLYFALSIVMGVGLGVFNATPAGANITSDSLESAVTINVDGAQGSGFFLNPTRILTAAHVVGDSPTVDVVLSSGKRTIPGRVTKIDAKCDVAEVEVSTPGVPLAITATLPQSEDVVYAVGSPIGGPVLSRGIVQNVSSFEITTTVPVDFGSSGGPLINDENQVIGLVVQKTELGEAVAIPIQQGLDCLASAPKSPDRDSTFKSSDTPVAYAALAVSILSATFSIVTLILGLRKKKPIVITLPEKN